MAPENIVVLDKWGVYSFYCFVISERIWLARSTYIQSSPRNSNCWLFCFQTPHNSDMNRKHFPSPQCKKWAAWFETPHTAVIWRKGSKSIDLNWAGIAVLLRVHQFEHGALAWTTQNLSCGHITFCDFVKFDKNQVQNFPTTTCILFTWNNKIHQPFHLLLENGKLN